MSSQSQSLLRITRPELNFTNLSQVDQLPVPLTPLIGRERELAELKEALARPEVRLLTVSGTGGMGKTRLALELANHLSGAFEKVCFIPLANVFNSDQLIATLARLFQLEESWNQFPWANLKHYLRSQPHLLILDNFEHLSGAVPVISELLSTCPSLKLVVTSRASLRIYGEYEYAMQPLALPDPKEVGQINTGALLQYPSIALFLQRAKAIRPDLELNEANLLAIAQLSIKLDGLPLALELAATRLKLLSPQALVSRLNNGPEALFKLLVGGNRDLEERQQALYNSLQWSYSLLSLYEQRLLRYLSVFSGSFSLEAIEHLVDELETQNCQQIPGASGFKDWLVEGLAALLDKSLLQRSSLDKANPEPRMQMLGIVKEFAMLHLKQNGEEECLRSLHTAYYLSLAEKLGANLKSSGTPEALKLVELEEANLRAALAFTSDNQKAEGVRKLLNFLNPGGAAKTPSKAEAEVQTEQTKPAAIHPLKLARVSAPVNGLTCRELEILQCVARGLTNAQIGQTLCISPRTVDTHLTTVYAKLGVTSRSGATRYALEQKIA